MELEGKVWKEGKLWLIEVPALDLMTQGKNKKNALFMLKDAIKELMIFYFKNENLKCFKLEVLCKDNSITVTSNNSKLFISLSLRRQREKSGSTIQEAAERLGSKSPNAYAQYERGATNVTIEKYEQLLGAANPTGGLKLRLAY